MTDSPTAMAEPGLGERSIASGCRLFALCQTREHIRTHSVALFLKRRCGPPPQVELWPALNQPKALEAANRASGALKVGGDGL